MAAGYRHGANLMTVRFAGAALAAAMACGCLGASGARAATVVSFNGSAQITLDDDMPTLDASFSTNGPGSGTFSDSGVYLVSNETFAYQISSQNVTGNFKIQQQNSVVAEAEATFLFHNINVDYQSNISPSYNQGSDYAFSVVQDYDTTGGGIDSYNIYSGPPVTGLLLGSGFGDSLLISDVPLPSTLPMLGAALLAVGGASYACRRLSHIGT